MNTGSNAQARALSGDRQRLAGQLNRSTSHQYPMQDAQVSPNGNNSFMSDPVSRLYECDDKEKFCEQVDAMGLNDKYTSMIKEAHGKMLESKTEMQKKLDVLQENYRCTNSDLSNRVTEYKILATNHDNLTKEFDQLRDEVVGLRESRDQTANKQKENEQELMKFKDMYYKAEYARTQNQDLTSSLKDNVCKLKVANMQLDQRMQEQIQTNEILKQNLKLKDTTISTKILTYDEKFKAMETEHAVIKEYARRIQEIYKVVDEDNKRQKVIITNSFDCINQLDKKLDTVYQNVELLMAGPMTSIDSNLTKLHITVTQSLESEINASASKRMELATENYALGKEFEKTKENFDQFTKIFSKGMYELNDVKSKNFYTWLPVIIISSVIFFFIGIIFYQNMSRF